VPHSGGRSCEAGLWFPGFEEHVQTPQDRDLNPGIWTRGHRSAPSIPENTEIYERRMRGAFPCVPLWHKRRGLSPPMCDMLTPGNATLACATWQRGFVSPMRVGLEARVVIHDSHTRVMRIDTMPTAAWKAAAARRWVAARIEGSRMGPGPQACGAGRSGWRPPRRGRIWRHAFPRGG
jgi:hypothetical protein